MKKAELTHQLLGVLLLLGGETSGEVRDAVDDWVDAHPEDIFWPAVRRGFIRMRRDTFSITRRGEEYFARGAARYDKRPQEGGIC